MGGMVPLCASVAGATAACAVVGAQFVAWIYICGGSKGIRNNPRIIKQRFFLVGMACICSPLLLFGASAFGESSIASTRCTMPADYLVWVGLRPPSLLHLLSASFLPLLLTVVLFTGPLVTMLIDYVDHGRTLESEQMTAASNDARRLQQLIRIRSLLVGPVAEEWVFRACMCPLLFAAGLSDGAIVAVASVIFGAAHLHHRFDARESWAAVLVQFTYTSLFGAYSSYLFLRTGLVYGPIAAHIFCNYMGLPSFFDMVEHRRRQVVTGAYVLGIIGFVLLIALDTSFRPTLFASMFWLEPSGCGGGAI